MNKYLIVDPANEKRSRKNSDPDWTVMGVIGLGPDGNKYLLDLIRDRMNLNERTRELFRLHRKWKRPKTYYEKYGKDSDIQHIEYVQGEQNYRFDIEPLGGQTAKNDRIKRLVPDLEEGRWYLPYSMHRTQEGKLVDVVEQFLLHEYDLFPMCVHDDVLDMLSRIYDCELIWPTIREPEPERQRYRPHTSKSWMSRL